MVKGGQLAGQNDDDEDDDAVRKVWIGTEQSFFLSYLEVISTKSSVVVGTLHY